MTLYTQTSEAPGTLLLALKAGATPATTAIDIAAAYTTDRGARLVVAALIDALGAQRFAAVPKRLVTSFDFMHTDPDALTYLEQAGFDIRIAESGASSYHPKMYVFRTGPTANVLVGSANLTARAFTTNTEAAVLMLDVLVDSILPQIESLRAASRQLTPDLLADYTVARAEVARPPTYTRVLAGGVTAVLAGGDSDEPLAAAVIPGHLASLAEAVAAGLDFALDSFWVDGGAFASGGAHNQLELSRAALRFFGVNEDAEIEHRVYEELVIRANGHTWADRRLAWHGAPGENGMVRMNLPTRTSGGYDYLANPIVLFSRRPGGYDLLAVPRASDLALSWRNASLAKNCLFRIGNTDRECGLF